LPVLSTVFINDNYRSGQTERLISLEKNNNGNFIVTWSTSLKIWSLQHSSFALQF